VIENNLARIADALEALVHKLDHIGCAVAPAVKAPPAPEVKAAAPEVKAAKAPPAPVVKAAPPAPVAKEAPPVVVETTSVMTAEELNASLVEQFKRLGMKQEPIREVMKAMGANSVLDLKPEQYSELLDKVKAL
jgi:phosphopantothenate synthetase